MGSVKVLSVNIRSIYIGTRVLRNCRSLVFATSSSIPSAVGERPSDSSMLAVESLHWQQKRHFLPKLPNPFRDDGSKGRTLRFCESQIVGYSEEQMFDVVSKVEHYSEFVPWCKESLVTKRNKDAFLCKLTVGFPPVVERYTSRVTVSRPSFVKSVCTDGLLFNHLETIWKFNKGMDNRPDTCTLDFFVDFQFRSVLHSHLAQMFFNEVVRTMSNAFLKRAQQLYGPQSIRASQRKKKIVNYNPTDL